MLKIEVKGYQEAKRIMDQLTNDMQKKILLSALRISTRPMLRSAKQFVPKRTGNLEKKIKVVKFKRVERKTEIAVALKHVFERTKKGKINEYYGKFVHEGTADPRTPRNSNKKKFLVFENQQGEKVFVKKTKGIRPNPYLEKAYAATEESTIQQFGNALAKAVQRFINKNFKPVK